MNKNKGRDKKKSSVVVISQSLKEIIKRYPSVNEKDIIKALALKCKYYSKIDEDKLEANFGFDKGRKFEFVQQISDSVLLINENYDKVDTSFVEFDFKKIYNKIIEILKYYCDIKTKYYPLISLWIIGTYFHNYFSTYPYLFFNAMKGSGKSRLLGLIKTLSKDGDKLSSMTEAVLFRERGTLCIDEFEGIGRKGNESFRELLNIAYKKGGFVKRMKKVKTKDGENQEVEKFEVYRPIVMANIWGMEEILADRCIEVILERSNKKEITQIMENFDTSSKIMEVVKLISEGNGSCGSLERVFENMQNEWNDFIKHTTSKNSNMSTTSTTSTTSKHLLLLFNKIKKEDLDGRNLELFFPLYLLADKCGVLKEILSLSVEISKAKREGDIYESRDVQLYDFISQVGDDHGYIKGVNDFIRVSELNKLFRIFIGSEEKDKWPNTWWLGQALKRLVLIREKKRSNGMMVILDIAKAKEKVRMFKDVETKEEGKIEVIKFGGKNNETKS